MRCDRRTLVQFPGTGLEAERPGGQGAHRADINHIARQFGFKRALDIGTDFHVLAAARRTQFQLAGHFLQQSDTAGAMDTTRHVGGNQRTDERVPDHAFVFGKARHVTAIFQCQVLQFAFTTLVTDRAIQRVVDQQEFHHPLLRAPGQLRAGKDLHAIGHRGSTGRQRLRHLLHLDHAHAAVGGNGQFLVVAETRHADTRRIGHLDNHVTPARLKGLPVDLDAHRVFRRNVGPGTHAAAPAEDAPWPTPQRLWVMWYSNSSRKCFTKLCTGQAAASPKAQMVRPSI